MKIEIIYNEKINTLKSQISVSFSRTTHQEKIEPFYKKAIRFIKNNDEEYLLSDIWLLVDFLLNDIKAKTRKKLFAYVENKKVEENGEPYKYLNNFESYIIKGIHNQDYLKYKNYFPDKNLFMIAFLNTNGSELLKGVIKVKTF